MGGVYGDVLSLIFIYLLDRYWMVVADRKSGGVHGRERASNVGRDAGWQRTSTGLDVWARRHHKWLLVPRGGNAAECHACGEEGERDDAMCANFAACGMGTCSQCMPGGTPESGWMCGRCEGAQRDASCGLLGRPWLTRGHRQG